MLKCKTRGILLAVFFDKLHIQGHVEKWCLDNCNPRKFPELNKINTMGCEKINFWLGGFKYAIFFYILF